MAQDFQKRIDLAPGLFLRPRPSNLGGSGAAVTLGGKPQLPEDYDWPEGLVFYAQVNLDLVPRRFEHDGKSYALEQLPEHGTLFFFLPLFGDFVYQGDARVIYVPHDVSHLPEREPPDSLGDLREEEFNWSVYWIDTVGLSPCGRLLYRHYADLLPFLTVRWIDGLSTHLGTISKEDLSAINALSKNLVAQALDQSPLPEPMDRYHLYAPQMDTRFWWDFPILDKGLFGWNFIFEWSKQFQIESLVLGLKHGKRYLAQVGDNEQLRILLGVFEENRRTVKAAEYNKPGLAGWKTKFVKPMIPEGGKFDTRAKKWMTYAQSRTGNVPVETARRFFEFLQEINTFLADEGEHIGIDAIDSWIIGHDKDSRTTQELAKTALQTAMKRVATHKDRDRTSGARVRRMSEDKMKACRDPELVAAYWDSKLYAETQIFGEEVDQFYRTPLEPPQLLGAPVCIQSQVDDIAAQNVLLLQITYGFGTQVEAPDGSIQLWIKPEDLKNRIFDRVEYTYFYS
ncbi:DUF1963 domain-containing protein [Marivita sp.]|uniref:DUF1963 domain-containing protein n=1 Tax=Marivita sp. TaxID=2003365 RepID=UPI003A8C7C54